MTDRIDFGTFQFAAKHNIDPSEIYTVRRGERVAYLLIRGTLYQLIIEARSEVKTEPEEVSHLRHLAMLEAGQRLGIEVRLGSRFSKPCPLIRRPLEILNR